MNVDPSLTITRNEALTLVPDLVKYVESKYDMDLWEKINAIETKAKKGQKVIVAIKNYEAKTVTYVHAKVSSVNHNDFRAIDGPIIRVKAGNISWRVDGCNNFLPV